MASKSQAVASKRKESPAKKDGKLNKTSSSASPRSTASEAAGTKKKPKTGPITKLREALGQALSAMGEGIRPKPDRPSEGVPERAGKVRTLWNWLGFVLHGIKFVVTKPHELLYAAVRRLIPSISTGQMNFLLIVLLVVFAWSIRSDTSRMLDSSVDIQEKTQKDVKALRDEFVEHREKQENYFATLAEGMVEVTKQGVAKVAEGAAKVAEGAAKVAEKASEIAGGAANLVGEAYYSMRSWFWKTSSDKATTEQL